MLHVRHAAAAINEGLCNTVLITHGESGRSRVGAGGGSAAAAATRAWRASSRQPYGPVGPPSMFTMPVLRYLKTYGLTRRGSRLVGGHPARVGGDEPARQHEGPDHASTTC